MERAPSQDLLVIRRNHDTGVVSLDPLRWGLFLTGPNRVGQFCGLMDARGTLMPDPDLIRFLDAQDEIYDGVVEELTIGRKRTHWMWFIFPQLIGLGHSATAQHYAIRDLDQARRYLADPILGDRLRQVVKLMIDQKRKSAIEILGSPDDLKFRSCLTLFREAASEDSDRTLFSTALNQFYHGQRDDRTLKLLA
jgi:uncharacterized protein (DUF1810 family)